MVLVDSELRSRNPYTVPFYISVEVKGPTLIIRSYSERAASSRHVGPTLQHLIVMSEGSDSTTIP